jgi:hypothetical protein
MPLAQTLILVLQLFAPSLTLRNSDICFVMPVRPYVHLALCINSAVTGGIFVELSTGEFYENRTKISRTFHEDLRTIILLLAVGNILCVSKANKTHCCLSIETVLCCLEHVSQNTKGIHCCFLWQEW